ncbi:MAG: PKD domain-containing protein [Crocinitomicaceae bacterium]
MKKILGLFTVLMSGLVVHAQSTDVIMNAGTNGTTVNTCLGGLYDSGGTGANAPYQNGESYVITVCPDVPGDFMTLQWTVFNLDCTDNVPGPPTDADNITIYDGDNTGAPTLGTYYCGDLDPGDLFGATPMNPSGCLTIEFNSNANGTGDFNAQLSCETPCDPPTAAGQILNGPAPDSIAVCIGEVVSFADDGSVAGPSNLFTLEQWVWKWFDGTPNDTLDNPGQVDHIFNTPGQYVVQLEVIDDNDCSNLNATDIQVFVTTYPSFDPFPSDTLLCVGESVDLESFPDQYEVEWSGFPLGVFIEDNCMEDLTGIVQPTPLTITGYDSNIALDNGNPDVLSICVEMEHSFLGDFVLQVQCPTGQIMTLHQQGGGGTNLGVPGAGIIDCDDPATFGTPYQYCFTAGAAQTWVQAAGGTNDLPAGDYLPIDPQGFGALDGCPINGQWNILFTDLWGADDGSMPGWSINFDPALDPPVTVFQPDIGSNSDSSYWDLASPGITSNSADGNSITVAPGAPGTYLYTYHVTNNFGCSFDSTVTVDVYQSAIADVLDTAVCDGLPVLLNAGSEVCQYTINLTDTWGDGWNGGYLQVISSAGTVDYTLNTGTSGTETFSVPVGENWSIQWMPGAWLNEVGYTVVDPGGGTVLQHNAGSNPPTNLNAYTADCPGDEIYEPLAGYVYEWTPGGTLDDPASPAPTATPATTTTYTLTMYPIGHPDCAQTDDVTINMGGGLDTGLDSTAMFCMEGGAEDLFNWLAGTPQTGGDWFDPNGDPAIMPMLPVDMIAGLYEYRKDSAGCTSSTFIDVQLFQTTATTTVTESDCQAMNGQVEITVTSGINPVIYSIDAGANFQASNIFTGLGGGNLYSFLVQDSLGCEVTVDATVDDTNVPTLDPVAFTDATCFGVCDGTVNLTGTNIVNYSIDNGTTTQGTGDFNGLCPGTYDVLVDNGFGCQVTDQFTIVEPPVLAITSISPDITVCPGNDVTATVTGENGIGNVVFDWESSGNALGTGTPITFASTGTMNVCVTMSDDCPTTDTECFNVLEPTPTPPTMTSDVTNGCNPLTVNFTNLTAGNVAQTTWTFSNGTSIVTNGSAPMSVMFDQVGVYDLTMEVITDIGCVYTETFTNYIEVFDVPHASFTHQPIPATIYDTEVNFNDFSTGGVSAWLWDFGPGVLPGSSTIASPTVVYPEGIAANYPVWLHVWNDHGCVDSAQATVSIVNDVLLYAPNIFTPDGDEFNETWKVTMSGIDIYDFHLVMFNRYGEIIWESYNPEGVWNGSYGGGGLVQDGTYIWVLDAKDSYTDKKYEFRGHVTVLK